jgi:hypothetical protein
MPVPKKGKTSRTKAVERLRRSKVRKAEKAQLEHEAYLQSFFDEDGNLLNIMETDEELLNNEQIFLTRLFREFNSIDIHSVATFLKVNYNKDESSELIDVYYSNEANKSWSQYIFNLTNKCLGFLNLYDLLADKFDANINNIIRKTKPTDKKKMTKELANDIFRKCSQDLDVKQFNFSELINNLLLIYAQNDQCVAQGHQNGGGGFRQFLWYCFLLWLIIRVILPMLGMLSILAFFKVMGPIVIP